MKIKKNSIVAIVAVAGVGAAALYGMRPKALLVDTAIVDRRPLEATIEADGRTRVRERYVIVAPVAGRLERIDRVEGSAVRAGDVIARLTAVPLDSQTIAQARARVDAASARALEAAAQGRMASASLDQRRRELSRANRLAEVGGVAPRVVEECDLAVMQATETEYAARERLRAAEADARQARATLLGHERVSSTTVLVRAPARGRVLRVVERSERIVAAGTPLLEMGDPSSLEIVVDVLSSDGARIRSGNSVRLAEWGSSNGLESDGAIGGHVRDVEPSAYTACRHSTPADANIWQQCTAMVDLLEHRSDSLFARRAGASIDKRMTGNDRPMKVVAAQMHRLLAMDLAGASSCADLRDKLALMRRIAVDGEADVARDLSP